MTNLNYIEETTVLTLDELQAIEDGTTPASDESYDAVSYGEELTSDELQAIVDDMIPASDESYDEIFHETYKHGYISAMFFGNLTKPIEDDLGMRM